MTTRAFAFPILLSAVAAIAGAMAGEAALWLHYLCKPLTTLLILAMALSLKEAVSRRYRGAVVVGLAFSLLGDVLLMLPGDLFVPGLLAFLLAHIAYCIAFAPGSSLRARAIAFAAMACLAAANLVGLFPRIDAELKIPVLAYVAVLAAMGGFALARAWTPAWRLETPRSARFAAVGAIAFVLSDSLLAWDRFAAAVPMPALLVLASYWLAQWAIARSVERD
jgi:uncharacterized membrane protein YhhN